MNVALAGLVAGAVWVGLGPGAGRLLLRRVRSGPVPPAWAAARRPGASARVAKVAGLGGAVVVGSASGRPLLAVAGAALVGVVLRVRRAAARDARAAAERIRVREFADLLAAELRAGRPARVALAVAARELTPQPAWAAHVAAAAESGVDVLDALATAAAHPGADGLREVAACWRVGERAGVRAGGYLLAGLPFFGLLLGSGLGARPWHVLLATPGGNAALAAGLALDVAGVAWLAALARSAEAAA